VARSLALGAVFVLLAGGCGGGGDTVEEASEAVASSSQAPTSLELQEVSGSVQRALGGAVSAGLGAQTRAPREIAGDITVVQGGLSALAQGQVVPESEAVGVRGAAERLGAWARSSCPG
jgi:hypothetical protein